MKMARTLLLFSFSSLCCFLVNAQQGITFQLRIGDEAEAPLRIPLSLPEPVQEAKKIEQPEPTGILDEASLREGNPQRILTYFGAYDPRIPLGTRDDWLFLGAYGMDGKEIGLSGSGLATVKFTVDGRSYDYNLLARKMSAAIPLAELAARLHPDNDSLIQVELGFGASPPPEGLRAFYFRYWTTIKDRLLALCSTVDYEVGLRTDAQGPEILLPENPFDLKLGLPVAGASDSYTLRAIVRLPNGKRKLAPLEYTKLTKVGFSKGDISVYWPRQDFVSGTEVRISIDAAFDALEARTNDTIAVAIYEGEAPSELRYFKFRRPVENYAAFNTSLGGVHFPVGLFTVKQVESGLSFISLPIGLAWGKKFYLWQNAYLGLSGMLNWQIFTTTEEGTDQQEFILSALFFGFRLDLNDYLSLGYGYGKSFATDKPDTGFMLVLGLGAQSLRLLQK